MIFIYYYFYFIFFTVGQCWDPFRRNLWDSSSRAHLLLEAGTYDRQTHHSSGLRQGHREIPTPCGLWVNRKHFLIFFFFIYYYYHYYYCRGVVGCVINLFIFFFFLGFFDLWGGERERQSEWLRRENVSTESNRQIRSTDVLYFQQVFNFLLHPFPTWALSLILFFIYFFFITCNQT